LTSFFNVNKYKYACKPPEDSQYRTNQPGQITYHRVKLFLLHQFTFVGAPHIWNGDEMGMLGADDPDNRKPLWWSDIAFDSETQSSFSKYNYRLQPSFDQGMFDYYKQLILLRKSNAAFTYGSYEMVDISNDPNVLAYYRRYGKSVFLVIFNNNPKTSTIQIPDLKSSSQLVFTYNTSNVLSEKMSLKPFSAQVVRM